MGVRGVKLEKHFDFFYSDSVCRLWGRLFSCQYDGPFKLDPEEVESGQFMSLEVSKLCKSQSQQLFFALLLLVLLYPPAGISPNEIWCVHLCLCILLLC